MTTKNKSAVSIPDLDAYFNFLGCAVRDRVSGFEGVCCAVSFDLYGCVQGDICPPVDKDGKFVDERWMDIHRIEAATPARRAMPVPSFKTSASAFDMLGCTVRDLVSGLEGVMASIAFVIDGSIRGVVSPRVDKEGKLPDGRGMDMSRFEVIGDTRAMPVSEFIPIYQQPKFGATPQQHTHGPAEKTNFRL